MLFRGVLLAVVAGVVIAQDSPKDPVSYEHKVEPHHALTPPLDRSQVYWNFGGSAVVTKNFVRLTQDTQDRKGWLWNDYPIESDFWEVEFSIEIFSKPNFGGDGMCMWLLSSDHDPSFADDEAGFTGPVFGMRNDFEGMGVCFDVYDNDQRRNNPTVFALVNEKGQQRNFNHDNDYEDDMHKEHPLSGFAFMSSMVSGVQNNVMTANKCVADVRNAGKPHKVLVKFLHKLLHVYVDSQAGQGYKFCFMVYINQTFTDYHLAFSAATGQVADVHDVHSVQVRYLDKDDEDYDDSLLDSYGSTGKPRSWSDTFFMLISLGVFALMGYAGVQASTIGKLTSARIDIVNVVGALNKHAVQHFVLQGVVFFLSLVSMNWISMFIQLPMVVFHVYLYFMNEVNFRESAVTGQGDKGHDNTGVPAKARIGLNIVTYLIATLYSLYRIMF